MDDTDAAKLALELQKEADKQARSSARIAALAERLLLRLSATRESSKPRESLPALRLVQITEDGESFPD